MKMPHFLRSLALLFCLATLGCSATEYAAEPFKRIWGTSTMRLEKKRKEAVMREYACSFDECYDTVLSLGGEEYDEVIEPYYYHSLAVDPEKPEADAADKAVTDETGAALSASDDPDETEPVSDAENEEDEEAEEEDEAEKTLPKRTFEIFHKSRTKGYIVFMGVPGSVDTTEVGVFFTRVSRNSIRIEVASLSTSAKNKAADIIFAKLNRNFKETE